MLLEFQRYLVYERRYNVFYLDFWGNFTISGLATAILEFLMMMDMPGLCHLMAQTYLGKVTKRYLSTTEIRNGCEKIGLGVISPPPSSCEGRQV